MAAILVPVSLYIQNLLSLVSELLSKLGNLKVGSTGFKNLLNIIHAIKSEIDKLLILTEKPFINANLFTKAEGSVDKLEDELERVRMTMDRIKFSDLELSPLLKSELKAFEDLINSIKANLKTVKDTAKTDFLGSDMGKVWLDLFDNTAITKSFSQITASIRKEVNDLTVLVNLAKLNLTDYQNAMKTNQNIENFLKIKNPLESTNLGAEKYALIFLDTKSGLRFRSGGRTILEEWLKTLLEVDDATVKTLVLGNVATIKGELEKRLKDIRLANQDVINKNVNALTNYDDLNAKLALLNSIMQLLGASELMVNVVEGALRLLLTSTSQAMKDYELNAVNAARSNLDIQSTSSLMRQLLEGLRGTLQLTNALFIQMLRTLLSFNLMKMAVVNFMGFNQVLNLTKSAIRSAINHIKELDTVMNNISIVTDMSTSDLWDLVDAYSKMAQTYGVSIKGAYEVSLIYYQQGLETADVLTLTNETLKLAKISGLDYATTTDYMTTALRGFKMEMSEASTVVDVYSNLAANTAVSLEELAVAMSRTASSMESVGATFEETSAMIGTMVAVTRESATNIGSAMKSIASRYGELTKDPTKLVDEEGEAMAFNKVDTALLSVGISMKTVDGQFREFTDVIVELGEKWDQLDSTQQRYIATLFAGNRQQSRFLALVSNVDLLKSNLDVAMNSEDTGTLQALKALDSIEAKTELVRVAYQLFYTTLGAENVWKGLLDGAKEVIDTLNSLPKVFGKAPLGAIAAIANVITLIKSLLTKSILNIASLWTGALNQTSSVAITLGSKIGTNLMLSIETQIKAGTPAVLAALKAALSLEQTSGNGAKMNATLQALYESTKNPIKISSAFVTDMEGKNPVLSTLDWKKTAQLYYLNGMMAEALYLNATATGQYLQAVELANNAIEKNNGLLNINTLNLNLNKSANEQNTLSLLNWYSKLTDGNSKLSRGLSGTAMALTTVGLLLNKSSTEGRIASGVFTGLGGVVQTGIAAIRVFNGNLSALPLLVMGIANVINGIGITFESPAERIERLTKEAEELNNQAKLAKAEYNILDNSIKKLDELKEKRHESTEAAEEYQTAVDELASKFPAMIAGFDDAGNIILDTTNAEHILAEAREKSKQATYDAALADLKAAKDKRAEARKTLKDIGFANGLPTDELGSIAELRNNFRKLIGTRSANNLNFDNRDVAFDEIIRTYLESITEGADNYLQDEVKRAEIINKFGFLSNAIGEDKLYSLENLLSYLEQLGENRTNVEELFYNLFYGMDSPATLAATVNTALQELDALLKDDTASFDDISKKFEEAKKLVHLAEKSNFFDEELFTNINDSFKIIGDEINKYVSLNDIYKGYEKEVVSAWQLSGDANTKAWEVLLKSSSAAALVTKKIVTDIGDNDYDEYKNEHESTWQEYLADMAAFINSLTTDELATFEKMMGDSANFTVEDFSDEFGYKINNTITDFLKLWFADGVKSINERLDADIIKTSGKDNLNELTDFYKDLNDARNEMGENITTTEENYFHTILATYKEFLDLGFTNSATNFGEASLNLFKAINNLDGSIEKVIWQLISDNGLNTIEGINATIDNVKLNTNLDAAAKDAIINSLDIIKSTIIPNINLSILAATSELLESWSDISGELSKAMSDGLTLQEADKLINLALTLGVKINTSDFITSGDKLILTSEKFNEYWGALAASADTNASEWLAKINLALNALLDSKASPYSMLTEEMRTSILSIIPNFDFNKYTSNGRITDEGYEVILLAINESLENLNKFIWNNETAAKLLAEAWNWNQGKYTGKFTDAKGEKIYESIFENLDDLVAGIAEDQISHFSKRGKGNAPQKRALLDNLYESYDTLISDVLSKGIENINLDDYTGIIAELKPAIQQALTKGSYTEFINTYVLYAGKSIDEANDLIAQAIEKENETVSVDLIKDFLFINGTTFKTSLSSLKELANKLNISLSDLLDKAVLSSNEAIDEYIVNAALIDNLDLNSAEFLNTIRDSINEFFSSLASYISNALKGSLSSENAVELLQFANQVGIGKLDFSQTADGLRVATDLAKQLVFELEKIDAIQGQIAFNELKDNLIETEDAYKTIGSNTAYIADLKRQLTYEKNLALAYKDANSAIKDLSTAFAQVNGNVDMYNRPRYVNEDGSISTFFSETFNLDEFSKDLGVQEIPFAALFTPVISETEKWDSDQLDEYVYEVMLRAQEAADEAGSELTIDFIKGADTKNLLIDILKFGDDAKAALEYENQLGLSIHEYSEAWEDARNLDEAPDNSSRIAALERELELAERINVVRGTAQDDSFNFMSNDIPAALNNPLNYYKNWAEAIKAVDEAMKTSSTNSTGKHTGLIDYQDFYNIVNEINDLAGIMGSDILVGVDKITGEAIKLNGDLLSAAELIEKGAAALTMTDAGDIKVALGDIGIDFSGGADSMAANVDDGVRAMAESQVKMLDGLILMLEAIVAMEQLGDIDVEGNGIDLSDLFKVTYDENGDATGREWYTEFTETYENWRQDIIDKIEAYDADPTHQINKDLVEAFRGISITLNGENFSLEQLIKFEPGDWKGKEELGNLYTSVINSMVKAAKSGNYDLDNIAASVLQELASSGLFDLPISIDVGDTTLVFTREGSVTIDWSSKDAQSVIEKAKSAYDNDIAKTKVALTEALTTWQLGGTLDESINVEWMLELNHHIVTRDGKTGIEWNGKVYDDVNSKAYLAAAAAWRLKDAGINFTEKNVDYKAGEVVTTTTIGSKNNIKVRSTGTTLTYESDITGKTYDTPTAMLDDEYASYSADFDENLLNRLTETKLTKEQWLWITYKIHTKTLPTFVDNNGKGIDLSADPTTRREVNDLVSGGYDSIQKEIDNNELIDNKDGTFTIPINGKMFTFESDGTNVTQDLYNALSEFIGIDSTLVDSIALGISNAFKGEAGTKIGEAIATGIKESLTPAEGEEQEIPIPTLILKPESIKLANTDTSLNLSDNLDITATAGLITINVDGQKATAVGTVTVDNLKGIGTGTLSVKNCKLTLLEDGSALLTTESGKTIPIDNLVGSGTGTLSASDCTFTFNDDGTVQFDQGETSIIVKNLVGTGIGTLSAGNCTLTYDESTGTATLTNGSTINITVPIPSDKITGSGILSAGLCTVTLDQNTLTLANSSGSVSVAIPSTVLTGIGKLNEENCNISFTPAGDLQITTAEGTTYLVTIPEGSLNAVASLLKADVEWADKPVFNTDNITLPDSLVMGTIDGIVRVNAKYELNDALLKSLDISKILGTTNNPDTIASTLGYQTIAIAKRQGMNNGENAPLVAAYLQNLRQMVAEGLQLSSLDLSNLDKLSLVGEKFSIDEMGGETLSTIISEITSLNSILSENNGLSLLESFSSIDGSNLLAISTALLTISENASNLANISWADVLKNIQQINSDIEPVELQFELDSTHLEAAAEKIGASIPNIMGTAIELNLSVFLNALSSVRTHIEELGTAVNTIFGDINHTIASILLHVSITGEVTLETPVGDASTVSGIRDENGNITFNATVKTTTDATEVSETVAKVTAIANVITRTDPTEVINTITSLNVPTVEVPVQGRYIGTTDLPEGFSTTVSGGNKAAGNFGLAKAAGTLMGELGPELVVQDGRYFVAGQNGAEFVNLQDDAIVFNHLQTEQLLKKGMSSTRGRAVTNERTAVAFAQGNVNGGPAMASASAALAALKQLRSMWASLASASVQDLAGAGGGGGGGGGDKDMAAYIKELEKWYNWLQKIAELEDKINYQEQLRSTISSSQRKNGSAYYSSLKDTLKNLLELVKTEQSLIDAQLKYFDKRRKELNTNGPFNSLYTFDENGQLKYKKGALNKLSKLNETDKYGKPKMSSELQYDYIVNTLGIDEQYLLTTASGEKIDKEQDGWQATAVLAFWDKMDADKEEMQSLHDSINEHSEALLAAQELQNEILQEMRDNQLAVELNVYDAIVDSRERAIEDAEAMRDALEESTTKFIDGLSSALDKERSMYEMQESLTDLDLKRRRLAILQRTGGSNSEIASLQSDIASSERDLYFDKLQELIDLILEASDKQIEKLDLLIELDKELLEYQKAHGLLWSEVADIMKMDSAAITDFITSNNSEWWAKSPVQSAQDLQDAIFLTDQWVEFRDDLNSFFLNIIDTIYNTTTNAAPDNPTSTADSTTLLDNNGNGSNNTRVKYKSLNEKKHKKITLKKNKKGKWETTKELKEDHDFDSKGKCTKCGYKKKKDSGNGTGGSGNSGNGSGSSNSAGGNGGEQAEPISTKFKYEQYSLTQHYKIPIHSDGTTGAKIAEAHSFSGTTCTKCFYSKYQEPLNRSATTVLELFKNNDNNKQIENIKSSSLSDINLTQDEVQKLRTSTLSTGLSAVNSAMKMNLAAINSSAYTTIDREKSTQIGSISLNMDVKQIANDYDAKRAGEKAMEEMLRIARKSTTATVRR